MKHKMKKYAIGGPTKYAMDDSDEGMSMSTRRMSSDDEGMSFKDAFKAARKAGDSTFTWQGKKYTTEMAGEKKSAAPTRVTKTETTTEVEAPESSSRRAYRGSKPGSARVGSGRYDDPTSSYGERVLSPFKRLVGGNLFGQREVERVARGAGVGTEEARRRIREAGMSGGGSVKKYAKGGSVKSSASRRADGIAQRGKTRGRII